MRIYRTLCYKVENLFIKIMSRKSQNFEVNIEKAERYRRDKEMKNIEKKQGKKTLEAS